MPNKKKNSNIKVMSPAKRKAEAQGSLLRKIKIDDEIKSLQDEVKTTEERRLNIREQDEQIRAKELSNNRLKEKNENFRREINKHTGVNKFTAIRNKEVLATIKEFQETTSMLHQLNVNIASRQNESQSRYWKLKDVCIDMLSKYDRIRDLYDLQFQDEGGDRVVLKEKKEKRKKELISEIEHLQYNFARMLHVDAEKQQSSEAQKTQTLEVFMDEKLGGLKSEISTINSQIKSVNHELESITSLVEARKREVSAIKQAIKNLPKKDISKTHTYRKVLEENERLQKQLEKYLARQDKLTVETRNILNKIEEEKSRKIGPSLRETEMQNEIEKMRKYFIGNAHNDEKDKFILDTLKQEESVRKQYLTRMTTVSTRMSIECGHEKEKLRNLRNTMQNIGSHNHDILVKILKLTQQSMNCVPIEYRSLR